MACGAVLFLASCGGDGSDDGASSTDGTSGGNGSSAEQAGHQGSEEQFDRIENYIRSDNFQRLVIELDYVEGHGPRDGVTSQVRQRLAQVLAKPDGVVVIEDQRLSSHGSGKTWTFAELDTFANDQFGMTVTEGTIKMHLLFLDGEYDEDGSGTVLGLAWKSTHAALFKDTINSSCQGGIAGLNEEEFCRRAEVSVMQHELGHVLGLVNNGLPMVEDHEDPDHPHHDESEGCVMYWAYENPDQIGSLLGDDPAPGFCDPSRQDIAAVRER